MSGEDEEEEGGKNDTENILQKALSFYFEVLTTADDFYLQGNCLSSRKRCSKLPLTCTWP